VELSRALRLLQPFIGHADRMNWARRIFDRFGFTRESRVKVVVGLGNPGKRYERTRHNVGFLVLDRLADAHGIGITKKKRRSLMGEWRMDGERILLVKPQTYMNRCGDVVAELFRYFPLSLQDLVVIHDDLDLPFGRIRIRPKGSAAGHRGVQSIMEVLGDENFFRVRVGIGRPPAGETATDYVLEDFAREEAARLDSIVARAADGVETLLREGPVPAMDKFNRAE
jgi:PTH1 family peptidyl-tRNA hydrolase